MLRKLILLSLLSFSTSIGYSQEKKYEYVDVPENNKSEHGKHYTKIDVNKIRFGAMVAPTITWMYPTTSTSDDGKYKVSSDGSKVGYMWGLMAEYYFANNYAIVSGFEINSQGGKINTYSTADIGPSNPTNTVISTHFDYRLQYIEIPVALKLISDELPKNGARIYGQVGLTLGINISRIATYNVVYFDENGVSQTASGNNQKLTGSLAVPPAMLQLNVGLGVEYPIASKLMFYTGLFFNNGFLPDATNPKNYTLGYKGSFSDGNTRLNNIALRLGLFF